MSRRPWLSRLRFVLCAVAVGLVVGLLLGLQVSASPVGRAQVLVRPLPGNAFESRSGDVLTDLETEAQLPLSDEVLAQVLKDPALGLSADALRRRMKTGLVAGTEVIVISIRSDTSLSAELTARRVGEAFLAVRSERTASERGRREDRLGADLAASEQQLIDLSREQPDNSDAISLLSSRIVTLQGQLRTVQETVADPGAVLGVSAPGGQSVRNLRLALAAGGALGVTAAALTARWLLGRARRRLSQRRPWRNARTNTESEK